MVAVTDKGVEVNVHTVMVNVRKRKRKRKKKKIRRKISMMVVVQWCLGSRKLRR